MVIYAAIDTSTGSLASRFKRRDRAVPSRRATNCSNLLWIGWAYNTDLNVIGPEPTKVGHVLSADTDGGVAEPPSRFNRAISTRSSAAG